MKTVRRSDSTLRAPSDDERVESKQDFFLSYAREDRAFAQRLYNDLQLAGLRGWLDTEDLLPGQDWRTAIHSAIRSSFCFVALLSERSVNKRGYVQKELKVALEMLDEGPEDSVFIIPVRLEDCRPRHTRLFDLHWVDLFEGWSRAIEKIRASVSTEAAKSGFGLPGLQPAIDTSRETVPEYFTATVDVSLFPESDWRQTFQKLGSLPYITAPGPNYGNSDFHMVFKVAKVSQLAEVLRRMRRVEGIQISRTNVGLLQEALIDDVEKL